VFLTYAFLSQSSLTNLGPQLAREAMKQISNAQRIQKLHMAISSVIAIGSVGVVGFLILNRELTTEERRLEEQRRLVFMCSRYSKYYSLYHFF